MNRREAIERVALLLGGTVIGAEFFISGCKPSAKKVNQLFIEDQVIFLNEVGDVILPETSTPGAKAANVGKLMAAIVNDCYSPEEQQIFMKGLKTIDDESSKIYGSKFLDCDSKQRNELVIKLDREQKDYIKHKATNAPQHYFRMIKELTLLGYFTSEVGYTKALRYVEVPGSYDPCLPYKKGDRAWAI